MDLAAKAKRIVIAMEHTAKGRRKILNACTYPITGMGVVDRIVTDLCVMQVEKDRLILLELAPGIAIQTVQRLMEAPFEISGDLKPMEI